MALKRPKESFVTFKIKSLKKDLAENKRQRKAVQKELERINFEEHKIEQGLIKWCGIANA